jgi:chemotaxis signal transduction protein
MAFLVFTVGGQEYACPVEQFTRVTRRQELEIYGVGEEPMPWWGGVVVEDGQVIPLVSLRGLWGYEALSDSVNRSAQTVLFFETGPHCWALLLDACRGVERFPAVDPADLLLSEQLTGSNGAGFRTVVVRGGRLLVFVSLQHLLHARLREQLVRVVKLRYAQLATDAVNRRLRDQELALAEAPSVEGYLALAEQYAAVGLDKEAARLARLAEQTESEAGHDTTLQANTELFGRIKPGMLAEVLQVLSRTTRTGELRLETEQEKFSIYFREGEIINAVGAQQVGFPAFAAAVQAREGTYRFSNRLPPLLQRQMFKSTESLLLETAHLIDENPPRPTSQ